MKIVYVAGPFRAPTTWQVEQNVRRAEEMGLEVARLGAMPLIPHTNTRFFDGELPDQFWLDGTMALLRACDAVMLVPGWERSSGARAERKDALARKVPVFSDLFALRQWLGS